MSEIKEVFDKMHIELPDGALELLNRYYEMLILSLIHISEPTRPY